MANKRKRRRKIKSGSSGLGAKSLAHVWPRL
jgi:hypothetical protein